MLCWFQGVLRRGGLPVRGIKKLRHTAASLLHAQGLLPRELMEMLGHSDVRITTLGLVHPRHDAVGDLLQVLGPLLLAVSPGAPQSGTAQRKDRHVGLASNSTLIEVRVATTHVPHSSGRRTERNGAPPGLMREITSQATGEPLSAPREGPSLWQTPDGSTLPALAGIRRSVAVRDWTDLHHVVEALRGGEWTSYGDLADAIGSSARAVGVHIPPCPKCVTAYRVLTVEGRLSDGFRWRDPSDTRDPVELLRREGVEFRDRRAEPTRRIRGEALRERLFAGVD